MPLILCIDDEGDLREEIADELRQAGYDVVEAADGKTGFDFIAKYKPDLVLCDVSMPGMNGYEVLSAVRERHAELADMPFLFLSALADRTDVIAGKQLGADDYLTKPIDLEMMLVTIRARLSQISRIEAKTRAERERMKMALSEMLAAETRHSFATAAAVLDRLAVPVLLLDGERRAQFVNKAARRLVERRDGLSLQGGELRGATPAETEEIRRTVEGALKDAQSAADDTLHSCCLRRPSHGRPLLLMVSALAPSGTAGPLAGAAVFVSDPDTRPSFAPETTARLYGLTPAETRVLGALIEGQRAEEIAEQNKVSIATVRSQIKSLLAKTETQRQAELVALVLGGMLPVRQAMENGQPSTA